jgi:hypothetical protein
MVECPSFKGKVFGSNPNVFKLKMLLKLLLKSKVKNSIKNNK